MEKTKEKQVKKAVKKVAKKTTKKAAKKTKKFEFKITKKVKVAEKIINKFHKQMEKLGCSVILFAGAKDDSLMSVKWASDEQIYKLTKYLYEITTEKLTQLEQPAPEPKP